MVPGRTDGTRLGNRLLTSKAAKLAQTQGLLLNRSMSCAGLEAGWWGNLQPTFTQNNCCLAPYRNAGKSNWHQIPSFIEKIVS